MAQIDMRSSSAFQTTAEISAERVTAFLRKVYGWMFVGLAVTAVVASTVAGSPALIQHIFSNQFLYFGLILAELGLVFYLSARVQTLAPNVAMTLFIVYAALNGVTLVVHPFSLYRRVHRDHVHGNRRYVRSDGALWIDDGAQLGRRRTILLHGVDRSHTGIDRRHVLAQRCAAVPYHRYRRNRIHGVDGVGRAAPETDGGNGPGGADGLLRRRRCSGPLSEFHQPLSDAP